MLTTSPISTNDKIAAAVARAREAIAARTPQPTYGEQRVAEAKAVAAEQSTFVWNTAQTDAIERAERGDSFCLIGAAGTGKTTTLRACVSNIIRKHKLPILERGTRQLRQGAPGVVLFSFTRRAVRNIAKQMPPELQGHCITGHKLLEFAPEKFEVPDGNGGFKLSMRFVPTRHRGNPLPANLRLVIVDESSMVATDFMDLVLDALPNRHNVQFIFLGDLHQLPPVYGDAILGHKLLELPIVELTEVYRQALESPIIDIAIQVKDGAMRPEFKVVTKHTEIGGRGKVTLHPWKSKLDMEEGLMAMQKWLRRWVREGDRPGNESGVPDPLNFDDSVILCPWNKAGTFGNIEMNKAIATELALKNDREVYEVIAGYNKLYFSVGDRILHDKRDAVITKIVRNQRYIGKPPTHQSKTMDYWGYVTNPTISMDSELSMEDIELMMDNLDMSNIEDRTHEASHTISVRYLDDTGPEDSEPAEETILSGSGEFNGVELAYCMSVHKSQGSEWRRVIFITHGCHQKMLSRELVYTAVTRAREELYIIMEPMMLTKASQQARIKGIKLEDKLKFFAVKAKERQSKLDLNKEEDDE